MTVRFKPTLIILLISCLSCFLEESLIAEKGEGAFLYSPYFTYTKADLSLLAHLESPREMS
ncbi:hypothetical protein [Candidatus Protochlamydia phocaeensis]|uniref:hypothetical protein n=1 Tax=Candidatus Protochlamydia phocaeensis TaxID=1414722 RepID=UPI0008393DFF|nr:hypothetical protein [Candidatus Protochlamydia phocaeensis]